MQRIEGEDLAPVAHREDQPDRRREAGRQRAADDPEDRGQARAAGEAEDRARDALGQPERAIGPVDLDRTAEPLRPVQPAARLALLVAGDEELEQAVGRQALIVGARYDRVGARLSAPGVLSSTCMPAR